MKSYSLALYDAFTEVAFGGSQAAVILDCADIDPPTRKRIAREIGMPATAFVSAFAEDWIEVQFISTVQELPMCGHGTLCLLTHMMESGLMQPRPDIQLRLPANTAQVSVERSSTGRFQVMLEIQPPSFTPAPPHADQLLGLLGLEQSALAEGLPLEIANGDFIHLLVPLAGLDAMRAIRPDFSGMVAYCQSHAIETIAAFCLATETSGNDVHLRDFCPAVGVSESAAAGTTNAALTSYLLRHHLLPLSEQMVVRAEQGLELGRPSSIQSQVTLNAPRLTRLQVGGIATRVFQGEIFAQR